MEVYLDNAATTKPRKEVIEKMLVALEEEYGNPSSLHKKGVQVEKEIKKSRKIIAKSLGCTEQEIIFTSSGTEANNLAIRGITDAYKRRGNHIITSKIEHKSVLSTFEALEEKGYKVTYLDVNEEGFIILDQLRQVMSKETILVSLMHVNNEIGSVQPIENIGKVIKQINPNTLFHVDGIQSFGKMKLNIQEKNIDSFSISGHKIYGPKGIGALYLKKGVRINPILAGGNQEMGLRSGTENVPGIYGIGEAVRLIMEDLENDISSMKKLKTYFIKKIQQEIDGIHIVSGIGDNYAPHIINLCFPGVRSEIMLHSLEQDEIYVSSGSACSSRKKDYSHVLRAIKLSEHLIDSSLRISINSMITIDQIDYAVEKMKNHYMNLKTIIKR